MRLPSWALAEQGVNEASARKVVSGASISLASAGVRLFTRVGTTIVLGRLLLPEDYGLIGMVMPILAFVAVFSDGGLNQHTLQSRSITQQSMSLTFWLAAFIAVIAFALLALSSPLVAFIYQDERLKLITVVISFVLLLSIFKTQHFALVKRCYRQDLFAIAEISGAVGGMALGIWSALQGAGYWALVVVTLSRDVIQCAVIWLLTRWVPSWPEFKPKAVREVLTFGGVIVFSAGLSTLCKSSDKILLGVVYDAQELGYYAMAFSLMMLPTLQVFAPVGGAVVPYLALIRDNAQRLSNDLAKVCVLLGVIVAPIMMTAGFYSEQLMRLVLGEKWVPAADMFSMLAYASVCIALVMPVNWVVLASGRPAIIAKTSIYITLATLASYVCGLPWGGVGVATAVFIYNILFLALYPAYIASILGLSYFVYIAAVLRTLSVSLGSVAIIYLLGRYLGMAEQSELTVLLFSFLALFLCIPLLFYVVFGKAYISNFIDTVRDQKRQNADPKSTDPSSNEIAK